MKHIQLLKKHSKNFFSFLFLFLLCFINLSAQTTKDTSTVKKQIMLLNQQMEDAFNGNDMNKVAGFYSKDGEIVYDNYTVRGRTNLDKYWLDLKDKGRGWKLSVVEIGGQGEFVYQLGKSGLKYISQGKETTSITNFVLIWRKQADGEYKIFRDYLTKTKFEKN
jgi:ketosteroid isomerase-like protein